MSFLRNSKLSTKEICGFPNKTESQKNDFGFSLRDWFSLDAYSHCRLDMFACWGKETEFSILSVTTYN